MSDAERSPFDWAQYEDALFQNTVDLLRLFGEKHRGEEFYAFCFECDTLEGTASPCLNSNEQLRIHYEQSKLDEYGYGTETRSFSDFADAVRWNSGDWTYQCMEREPTKQAAAFESAMLPFVSAYKIFDQKASDKYLYSWDLDYDAPHRDRFLASVRHVLYRMHRAESFNYIRTEPDFRYFVIGICDEPEDAMQQWSQFLSRMDERR